MLERQPLLVNPYERAVSESLDRVCGRWDARVFPKVRVADVVKIDSPPLYGGEALTAEERRYALMAHFDFVIADGDAEPQFAVEFDGKGHATDPKQIERDRKKNAICGKAIFPLLRVGSRSLKTVGEWQLLEWLIELWFLARSLEAGEDEDEDEVAERRAEWGLGREDEFDYQATGQVRLGLHSFSVYDPFADARRAIAEFQWRRKTLWTMGWTEGWIERGAGRGVTGYVALPIDRHCGLLGRGRCDLRDFWWRVNVLPEKLAQDLALADLAEQLRLYQRGEVVPLSNAEIGRRTATAEKLLLTTLPTPSRREMRQLLYEQGVAMGLDPITVLSSIDEDDLRSFDDEDD